jgi:Spy/CpxP family protein refolding chaperone
MPGKLKTWLCGAALAGAVAMSLTSLAMEPSPGMGMGADPARMLAHLGDRLGLSSEQKSQLEGLLSAGKEAKAANHARMNELRTQMLAMRDSFDEQKARQVADEIGQVTASMVYQASATWAQVYRLLDAEQKAQLDSMMARRAEHRGKWRDAGGKQPD